MKVSCEAKEGGSLSRAWKHMSWLYYQYLLVTALYMLEPWERTIFSILLQGEREGHSPAPPRGEEGGGATRVFCMG